jgi:hypothetical protein
MMVKESALKCTYLVEIYYFVYRAIAKFRSKKIIDGIKILPHSCGLKNIQKFFPDIFIHLK